MAESKKTFDLDVFSHPFSEVPTAQGCIYVYRPSAKVSEEFASLSSEAGEARGRILFPKIASLVSRTSFSEDISPLPDVVINGLSDSEITTVVDKLWPTKNESEIASRGRSRREKSPWAYVDEVMSQELERERKESRDLMRKALDSINRPAASLLDELNKSSSRLDGLIGNYSHESRLLEAPFIYTQEKNHLADFAKQANADRENARKTADTTRQMTEESARMLKELVNVAGIFMLRFDERDVKSDKQLSAQLKIAIGSLVLSVVLSGFAAFYAYASFKQDKAKNLGDEMDAKASVEREVTMIKLLEQQNGLLENLRTQPEIGSNAAIAEFPSSPEANAPKKKIRHQP